MRKRNFISAVNFRQAPNINFLKTLTTPTGILQHTKFGVPHRSLGYSLDDNARALIVVAELFKLYKKKEYLDLALTYLSFLVHAKRTNGFFNNFQTYDQKFLPKVSEDAFGECIWALGVTTVAGVRNDLTFAARNLFSEIENNIEKIGSPRAKAYAVLGLCQILKSDSNDRNAQRRLKKLVADLIILYEKYQDRDWNWFESYLNYANHIFPAALFAAYPFLKEEKVLKIATDSLEFLEKQTRDEAGVPSPVGSDGWYKKGGERAVFDQQPVEASYAVLANSAAYKAVGERKYLKAAKDWFAWFYGFNIKDAKVYDKKTGGCFDAVNERGVNLNQGAESIVCYLIAYLTLAKIFSSSSQRSGRSL